MNGLCRLDWPPTIYMLEFLDHDATHLAKGQDMLQDNVTELPLRIYNNNVRAAERVIYFQPRPVTSLINSLSHSGAEAKLPATGSHLS